MSCHGTLYLTHEPTETQVTCSLKIQLLLLATYRIFSVESLELKRLCRVLDACKLSLRKSWQPGQVWHKEHLQLLHCYRYASGNYWSINLNLQIRSEFEVTQLLLTHSKFRKLSFIDLVCFLLHFLCNMATQGKRCHYQLVPCNIKPSEYFTKFLFSCLDCAKSVSYDLTLSALISPDFLRVQVSLWF